MSIKSSLVHSIIQEHSATIQYLPFEFLSGQPFFYVTIVIWRERSESTTRGRKHFCEERERVLIEVYKMYEIEGE
jgi:hypothetical protein